MPAGADAPDAAAPADPAVADAVWLFTRWLSSVANAESLVTPARCGAPNTSAAISASLRLSVW
ncbi:hypothetical protein HKD39_04505 [Nakamurella sp. DB0629]|uniref:Uncharacterized protein n=1 Tax=Nakamurella aerolata TaxID=1656892 RepID=A0A849A351_9ACTN|nr:hypothetical protein [Nakamurella aerolata]